MTSDANMSSLVHLQAWGSQSTRALATFRQTRSARVQSSVQASGTDSATASDQKRIRKVTAASSAIPPTLLLTLAAIPFTGAHVKGTSVSSIPSWWWNQPLVSQDATVGSASWWRQYSKSRAVTASQGSTGVYRSSRFPMDFPNRSPIRPFKSKSVMWRTLSR
ncbi:hypothetical protein BDM02DRAFT_3131342 [Thelephora ganbajun]|uniref:Uncharacterized protein n=1 Tax=Thelephora ganbajun TaxID=370292 RepID=A0ACB6Z6W7_THEGA|nr:hypothetical protein BDM02DRAFT_3131342 [Thelephora ganbajun]